MQNLSFVVLILLFGVIGWFSGSGKSLLGTRSPEIERAETQVNRIAEDLDRRTTATGVYIRVKDDEIKERDPWDTPIEVQYSQGGVAEIVTVRSAGPDRTLHSKDDISTHRMTANAKGIGEGIKKNAEETSAKIAKGIVTGTVDGVKQSIKDSLPFTKKKSSEQAPKTDQKDES